MCTVTLKLGGPLLRYSPENWGGDQSTYDIEEKQLVSELIIQLGIPEEQPLFVILNSTVINKEALNTTRLQDGDELSLMPPIQAG